MSGIWQIFKNDLSHATRNAMSVILLCGLIVIPSVFTWFNVIASWEPFDNTKNLKVAVASVDEGYTSSLIPIHINVGSTVESTLRANDQMDWIITSKEDAIAGTKSGEYYAAMVLPKDFSERMLTFYTAGSKQTEIEYYTNDKSNPLAPLITSEGADDLSAQINVQFTQELDTIALSLVSSLATSLESPESVAAFTGIEQQVGSVGVQLRSAATTATMFSALLESSVPLANSAERLVSSVESQLSTANKAVANGNTAAKDVQQAIANANEALSNAFANSIGELDRLEAETNAIFGVVDAQSGAAIGQINGLSADIGTLIAKHQEFRASLAAIANDVPEAQKPQYQALLTSVDTAIAQEQAVQTRINKAADDITTGTVEANELQGTIVADIGQARSALQQADTQFVNEVKPLLDQLASTIVSLSATFSTVTTDMSSVSTASTGAVALLERAAADTRGLADALSRSAETFAAVQAGLSAAISSGDIQQLVNIIGTDPATLAKALAQPIGLETISVYPVVSFGAGMAPLYTMLSLWVGALLLCVTLRVQPTEETFAGVTKYPLHEQFLGRYLIFALLGLAQSTLVFGGNILLVGLQPVHPFLFMLTGWVTSLVFTFLIYTLVVSLSDAGKALAVVLLVIQVAGAGGAYPLPLLPQWFQNVSPFLPGTHSIDAIRSSLAGIYENDYWISIGWLLVFLIPAALLGLLLRKPMIGMVEWMEAQLASTKLL